MKTVIYFPKGEKPEVLPEKTVTSDPEAFLQQNAGTLKEGVITGNRLTFTKGYTTKPEDHIEGNPFTPQPIKGYAVLIPVPDDFTL